MTSRYGSRVEEFQIGKSNVCFENELFVRASENSNILVMLSINAHDWKARPKAIGSGKIWKTRIGECNAVAGSWITKKKTRLVGPIFVSLLPLGRIYENSISRL